MARPSNKTALGQILPGFWIGRMAAVRAIFELQQYDRDNDNHQQDEEWTIISVLSSRSIISAITDTLKEEQRKFGRHLVTHHEVWDLPDKAQSDFVSDRLEEILSIISNSIETPVAPITPNNRIKRPRRNVLIHCARGVSRSAAVCSAWLISRGGYTLEESLNLIRSARQVNPNLGFLAGLRAIEKCNGNVQKARERLTQSRNKPSGKDLPKEKVKEGNNETNDKVIQNTVVDGNWEVSC